MEHLTLAVHVILEVCVGSVSSGVWQANTNRPGNGDKSGWIPWASSWVGGTIYVYLGHLLTAWRHSR